MKVPTIFLLIVLAAITAFTALNWNTFITPTTLSLGVAVLQVPLGLVMLGLLVFLTGLFLVFVVYLQTSMLLETRQQARDLQAKRELEDRAEASRFTELRGFFEVELRKQADLEAESRTAVLARIDQLDSDLHSAVEESGNTLCAYFDELEDRLEKELTI